MWKLLPLSLALFATMTACSKKPATVPIASKQPVELEKHGDVRVDEYFWLKQRDNPEVIAYLEAENDYADRQLSTSSGLKKRLIEEMKGRIKDDEASAPYRHGGYYYYERYEPGKEYPIYARKEGSLDAAEEIILDINALAGDEAYFAVRGLKVSPDHKLLAYGVDTQGRRFYDLYFVDLETGKPLADVIEDTTANFSWAADSKTIVYTQQEPETLRWYRVLSHTLGSDIDTLLYEESDETFSSYVYTSLSGTYLYVVSQSTLATEVRYIASDLPDSGLQLIEPRRDGHEYFVTDGVDRFYILSNDDAENFQLFESALEDTSRDSWSSVVPHRTDALIEDFSVFSTHVVIEGKRNGANFMEVLDRESGESRNVEFDEDAFLVYADDNYEYQSPVARYVYESMTRPGTVYDLALDSLDKTLIKQEDVPGYEPDDYYSERLFAETRDGTRVPVSLVYRKGLELDGQNPLLQYGYGSYGVSIDPEFDPNLVSLLDRGFVFAIAHIRGGAEMGRQWYYDGRQFDKMNTFTDFIDVSRFLIDEGYTSPEHLYARGGSAGGLLMGAIANMAPELYNGISTRVPFVDVITTMLDDSIPLTTSEYDEWGNPNDKADYDYMLAYSPYDQISAQDYPNILVTTGLHDSQVQYWEPAKWVARLRDRKTDDNLLLFKTDMQAGHSGKTGRYQSLEDDALYYAFFLSLEGQVE